MSRGRTIQKKNRNFATRYKERRNLKFKKKNYVFDCRKEIRDFQPIR